MLEDLRAADCRKIIKIAFEAKRICKSGLKQARVAVQKQDVKASEKYR
jgi:hypothetical protein